MKIRKILTLAIAVSVAFIACEKEVENASSDNSNNVTETIDEGLTLNIEQKQNATMFFYTSTGCPGCGSWGMPAFASLQTDHEENVVPVGIHIKYNDPLITETSEAIAAIEPVVYIRLKSM